MAEYLYWSIYQFYKEKISSGALPPGAKLPSVRKCAAQFNVSVTTSQTAYLYLAADGYILSRPQSGYYVTTQRFFKKPQAVPDMPDKTPPVLYDFSTSNVDRDSFDFDLWRRYVKSAIRQDDRMCSYGEPQGEPELRLAISQHLEKHRNVVCSPDRIVIGAGVQSLLQLLCPILKGKKSVYFQNPDFKQGIAVFEDHGFTLENTMEKAGVLYLTPSQETDEKTTPARLRLLEQARERGQWVIEDDYDGEFRSVLQSPPRYQGLDGGRHVIYLGTFSKLLLPSIRISFVILPDSLCDVYAPRRTLYNQTASKTEQLALARFMLDGHFERQIKKLRRLYHEKAAQLKMAINTVFGAAAQVQFVKAGLAAKLTVQSDRSAQEIQKYAKKRQLFVSPVENSGKVTLLLSVTGLAADQFLPALQALKRCL